MCGNIGLRNYEKEPEMAASWKHTGCVLAEISSSRGVRLESEHEFCILRIIILLVRGTAYGELDLKVF